MEGSNYICWRAALLKLLNAVLFLRMSFVCDVITFIERTRLSTEPFFN